MIGPKDFLSHAKFLIDPLRNPKEIDRRSAVSRAYYSLFHESKNLLNVKRAIIIGNQEAHKQVKDELYKINKKAGRQYKNFRRDRTEADYNLSSTYFTQNNSAIIISQMESFLNNLSTSII